MELKRLDASDLRNILDSPFFAFHQKPWNSISEQFFQMDGWKFGWCPSVLSMVKIATTKKHPIESANHRKPINGWPSGWRTMLTDWPTDRRFDVKPVVFWLFLSITQEMNNKNTPGFQWFTWVSSQSAVDQSQEAKGTAQESESQGIHSQLRGGYILTFLFKNELRFF